MKSTTLRTTLLSASAVIAALGSSVGAAADDLTGVRAQIDALKDRIATIEADRARVARRAAAAAAVEAGDKPKSWKLPGTNTSMQIGGYVKLDLIWDLGVRGGQTNNPGAFPRGNAANNAQNGGAFQFHARQSRLFVRTFTPTDWGELTTHIEGDFFGGANGQNAPIFRLRHAFGCLGAVCAGQFWSTWMPIWALPATLDFAGPTGAIFLRQAQLRFTHSFGGGWTLQAALESPVGGGATSSGGGDRIATVGAAPALVSPGVAQQFPDVVVTLAHQSSRGRIWVGGILRQVENGLTLGVAGNDDSVLGWGIAVAGVFKVTRRLKAGVQAWAGKGVSSYLTFNVADAFLKANGSLDAVFGWGAYGWVQWHWTDTLHSLVAYGFQQHDVRGATSKRNIAGGIEHQSMTVHANLVWSPVPAVNIGVEYIHSFRWNYNAANNIGHRVQIVFQYKF